MKKGLVLFDIDYVLFDTGYFKKSKLQEYKKYKETLSALEELKDLATLGIFSKGEYDWQMTKLRRIEIVNFFNKENIYIFNDKNAEIKKVINKYKDCRIFLVDDKLQVLQLLKEHSTRAFGIWLKRGPYAESQKTILNFKPDAEVENLTDAVKIIRSNF